MTPHKRCKIIRRIVVLVVVMTVALLGRGFLLDQNLAFLILGRKPGSAPSGTPLVRTVSKSTNAILTKAGIDLPPEAGTPLRISFGVIGDWKYIEGKTPIPQKVLELDGKWVEISGFMISDNRLGLMPRFYLIQSLWGCCFGRAPDINHVIDVSLKSGNQVVFYPEPVKVLGKFSVKEIRENGYLVSIYQLEAYRVVVK